MTTRPHQPAERIQVSRQRETLSDDDADRIQVSDRSDSLPDDAAEQIQVSRRRDTSDAAADRVPAPAHTDVRRGASNGAHSARDESRAWAKEVKAKKKAIAWRYRQQRQQRHPDSFNKTWVGRRRYETEDLIRYRFGTLPDTDDRDIFLRLWCWSNPYSRDPAMDLREFGHRLGVRLSDAEVEATIRYVEGKRRKFSAKTFGRHLRLSKSEWLVLRPTTMVPFDCTPKELERLRRVIKTQRERERSRRKGAEPRAEYLAAVKGVPATNPAGGRPTIGDRAMTDAERAKRYRAKMRAKRKSTRHETPRHETVPVEHLTSITSQRQFRDGRKRKDPQAMKDQLPLHTLPSCAEKATASPPQAPHQTSHAGAAADAFARQQAEVVGAASVYGGLPLELRLMALGLAPSGVVTTERDGDQADQIAA
jgi:hypothetical protein